MGMSWIEIIKVQTASKTAAEECSRYMCTLYAQKNTHEEPEISIYSSGSYPALYMIILAWPSGLPESPVSTLSDVLIQELGNFGLVDHSKWGELHLLELRGEKRLWGDGENSEL
jgi:hypothetical protein